MRTAPEVIVYETKPATEWLFGGPVAPRTSSTKSTSTCAREPRSSWSSIRSQEPYVPSTPAMMPFFEETRCLHTRPCRTSRSAWRSFSQSSIPESQLSLRSREQCVR